MTKENKFYKESFAPLEPEDLKKLKKGLIVLPIFSILFLIFFYFFYNVNNDKDFKIIVIGFLVFFLGLMIFIFKSFFLDLRDKEKKIIQGVITYKKIRTSKSTSKKGTTKWYYYLYFGDIKQRVEGYIYHKFEIGDLVEIHLSKRIYNVIYKYEILKKGVFLDEIKELNIIREENERKNTKAILLGFALFVIIAINFILYMIADCFNCSPEYPTSINKWQNLSKSDIKQFSTNGNIQQILFYLNDTLLDSEEEKIIRIFNTYDSLKQLDSFVYEINSINVKNKTLSEWVHLKFDEQYPNKNPLTFIELYKKIIYAISGKHYLIKENTSYYLSKFWLSDLDNIIINSKVISYEALSNWLNHYDISEKQKFAYTYIEQNNINLSESMNEYIKSALKEDFSTNNMSANSIGYYKKLYELGRKKYNIK